MHKKGTALFRASLGATSQSQDNAAHRRAGRNSQLVASDAAALTADEWSEAFATVRSERAVEYTYNMAEGSLKNGAWEEHEVLVKVDRRPVAKGAMRECFRVKLRDPQQEDCAFAAESEEARRSPLHEAVSGIGPQTARRLADLLGSRSGARITLGEVFALCGSIEAIVSRCLPLARRLLCCAKAHHTHCTVLPSSSYLRRELGWFRGGLHGVGPAHCTKR